jgi:hypothetical protein
LSCSTAYLRFALSAAAGVAAFEFVVGEEFDVIPPGLAVEMRSGLGRGGDREQQREQ